MTWSEAIKDLNFFIDKLHNGIFGDKVGCLHVAISAIEQNREYQAIGTVKEIREAVGRQKEMKTGEQYINGYGNKKAECLNCHCVIMHPANYCKFCGQKLDWSDNP